MRVEPIIKAKTYQNSLKGKNLEVSIRTIDENRNDVELYKTEGKVEHVDNDLIEVKRKTQPNFKVPYTPSSLIDYPKIKDEYSYVCYVNSKNDIDPNFGIILNKKLQTKTEAFKSKC